MLDDIRARLDAVGKSRIVKNSTVYERYMVERGILGNGGTVRTVTNK